MRLYTKEEIKNYRKLVNNIITYLEKEGVRYKVHPTINEKSEFLNNKIKVIPLLDIYSLDGKRAARLWTENLNGVLQLKKKMPNYQAEVELDCTEEKDENGDFVFFPDRWVNYMCKPKYIEKIILRLKWFGLKDKKEITI